MYHYIAFIIHILAWIGTFIFCYHLIFGGFNTVFVILYAMILYADIRLNNNSFINKTKE